MIDKFRYFPWLGFKTLSPEDVELLELDTSFTWKGLVFEWLDVIWLIFAKGTKEDTNVG